MEQSNLQLIDQIKFCLKKRLFFVIISGIVLLIIFLPLYFYGFRNFSELDSVVIGNNRTIENELTILGIGFVAIELIALNLFYYIPWMEAGHLIKQLNTDSIIYKRKVKYEYLRYFGIMIILGIIYIYLDQSRPNILDSIAFWIAILIIGIIINLCNYYFILRNRNYLV